MNKTKHKSEQKQTDKTKDPPRPRPVHAPTGDLELEESLLFHSCVEMYRKLPKHFLIEYIRNLKTYVQKLAHEPGGLALSMGCSCSGTGTAN